MTLKGRSNRCKRDCPSKSTFKSSSPCWLVSWRCVFDSLTSSPLQKACSAAQPLGIGLYVLELVTFTSIYSFESTCCLVIERSVPEKYPNSRIRHLIAWSVGPPPLLIPDSAGGYYRQTPTVSRATVAEAAVRRGLELPYRGSRSRSRNS